MAEKWKLGGGNVFKDSNVLLPGEFDNWQQAEMEADRVLKQLEKSKVTEASSGNRKVALSLKVIRDDGTSYTYVRKRLNLTSMAP